MTAERLLRLFDRVADSPDAVPRLRQLVLDLAVRGRLTATTTSGKSTKTSGRSHAGWNHRRLAEFLREDTRNGFSAKPQDEPSETVILRISAGTARLDGIVDEREHRFVTPSTRGLDAYQLEKGDLLACRFNGNKSVVGRMALFEDLLSLRPIFPDKLIRVRVDESQALPDFVRIANWSDVVRRATEAHCTTTVGNWGISASNLKKVGYPLPPLDEQGRIVAKVAELMALCDRLEAAQKERDAARRRVRELAARSFGLGASHGSTASLSRVSSVAQRPEDMPSLRSSILRLAVQGRLQAGSFQVSTIAAEDSPFGLPEGWKWSKLSALGKFKGGATPSKANPDYWIGAIPWVSPRDMKVDYVADARLHITEAAIAGSAASLIEPRSLLFVVRGMILGHSFPVAVTQVPVTINQDMKALVPTDPSIADYLLVALKALKPEMLARVKRSTHGTGRIEGLDYRGFPIPLPPRSEQKEIVAKVNELMTLCDQLEAHLKAGDIARSRLLDALIAETLAEPHAQSA